MVHDGNTRAGRRCAGCGNPLSRYNPAETCQHLNMSRAPGSVEGPCPTCGRDLLRSTVAAGPGVGQRIAELRLARGFTQQVLADKAGLSCSIVFQLEQGVRKSARYTTLAALADTLSVPVAALFEVPGPVDAPGGRGKRRARDDRYSR